MWVGDRALLGEMPSVAAHCLFYPGQWREMITAGLRRQSLALADAGVWQQRREGPAGCLAMGRGAAERCLPATTSVVPVAKGQQGDC